MTRVERIADAIWTEALGFSDIPETLYDKVKIQVPVKSYFKGGVFDEPAFRAAVEAELKEWDRLLTPSVLGCGYTISRDTLGKRPMPPKMQEAEDEKWVTEMLKFGGQVD